MSASSIPTFLDAVVAAFVAALPQGTPVHDGPVVTDDDPDLQVYVGVDDLDGTDEVGSVVDASSSWATTGRTRDETYTVPCVVVVRNGDGDLTVARRDAFAALVPIEASLRTDPTVSAAASVLYTDVVVTRVGAYEQEEAGAIVRVYFHIKVRARI